MTGKLIGIAVRPDRYVPLVDRQRVDIAADGLDGDHAGRWPDRIVSIIAAEDWAAACADLDPPADPVSELPWRTRRANLLLDGVRLPRVAGAILRIGAVELEISGQTHPCKRMEDARAGLLKALAKEWRGGVLCRVIIPGQVQIGDNAEIVSSPPEVTRRLP